MIETIISIIILCLTLQLFQTILENGHRYMMRLQDITAMQWWVASHQLEISLHRDQYKECSQTNTRYKTRGIYFISNNRLMVHRPYKNQWVRSRQMSKSSSFDRQYKLVGYVPLLFDVKKLQFYEQKGYLYVKGQFENGKEYESIWRIPKGEKRK